MIAAPTLFSSRRAVKSFLSGDVVRCYLRMMIPSSSPNCSICLVVRGVLGQPEKPYPHHKPPDEPQQAVDGHEDSSDGWGAEPTGVVAERNNKSNDTHVARRFAKGLAPQDHDGDDQTRVFIIYPPTSIHQIRGIHLMR